jgi:hypothetical protein
MRFLGQRGSLYPRQEKGGAAGVPGWGVAGEDWEELEVDAVKPQH